jgi:hypothetical protein
MYGVIAVVLLGLALWVVGQFYGLPLIRHPVVIGLAAIVVFTFGVFLRKHRRRVHNRAFAAEHRLDKEQGGPL